MAIYEATYSYNIRRHARAEIDAASDEEAERIVRAEAMTRIEADLVQFQNADGFSDNDVLDPYLSLDKHEAGGTEVLIDGEAIPDPDAPVQPKPLPVDLIVAARELLSAFGGNVPDWIEAQALALELALKPFADADIPMPEPEGLRVGAEEYLYRLEQRADVNSICGVIDGIITNVFGDVDDEEIEAAFALAQGPSWGDVGAVATVTVDGKITELWACEYGGCDDQDVFTLVWLRPFYPRTDVKFPADYRPERDGTVTFSFGYDTSYPCFPHYGSTWNGFDNVEVSPEVFAIIVADATADLKPDEINDPDFNSFAGLEPEANGRVDLSNCFTTILDD